MKTVNPSMTFRKEETMKAKNKNNDRLADALYCKDRGTKPKIPRKAIKKTK